MSSAVIATCKFVLFSRCLRAVLLSVGIQFLLLTVFLLFVNFQLMHPLNWIMDSLRLFCSFYTWFASIPLLGCILFYGMSLSHQHLAERRYCPTRYRWLVFNGPRKLLFLVTHILVGYFTAWLYTGYLHTDYRNLVQKCYGQDCLNSYHIFLLGMGIAAGCYYFTSVYMKEEISIEFDFILQAHPEKLRELLYSTLLRAPISSFIPTLCYVIVFWLLGALMKYKLSHLLHVDMDDHLLGILDIASNGRLLFYAWLLTAQIVSNMHLMRCFYSMLLSEPVPMVVACNRVAPANDEVNLVAGLGILNAYVVQCLAANFLYEETRRKDSAMRADIFQLTQPGNRPANWRALCDQCISIVGNFTEELGESMRKISLIKDTDENLASISNDCNSALLAEKVLLRKYNHMHGIRPVVSERRDEPPAQQWNTKTTDGVSYMPNWCERASLKLEMFLQQLLQSIPGIVYFFSEPEGAKTQYLLNHALPVIWICQALGHICVASLKEDQYGAVQDDLPAIIKALNRLKGELDKLSNAMPDLRSTHCNFNHLRNAVRRSLFNICNSFYNYLGELTTSGEELRQLQAFVYQG